MRLRLGRLSAECPYCGSKDFAASDEDAREVVCASCGGYASRAVVLERLAERVAELGRLTLARLSAERRRRGGE